MIKTLQGNVLPWSFLAQRVAHLPAMQVDLGVCLGGWEFGRAGHVYEEISWEVYGNSTEILRYYCNTLRSARLSRFLPNSKPVRVC